MTLRTFVTASLVLIVLILTSPLSAPAATVTLSDCLSRSAIGNPALKVKSYDETISAENVTLADSAYFPRIDLLGGYTAQLAPQQIRFNNNTLPTQDADYGFFSLTFTQLLYDFGRRDARYRQAALLREATADLYHGQEKELFLQVVKGYYGVLHSQKLLLTLDDEVKRLSEHLRVAKNLHEQGVVTRNDLLQAEVRLSGSRQRRLSAENEVEKGWLLLNYLTGQPEAFRGDLEESVTEISAPGGGNDITSRPEYRAELKSVAAGEFDVEENRKGFYPELFFKGDLNYLQNSTVKEQVLYAATLGVRFNLFEGNATTARLRQAVARRSRNEARLNDLTAQFRLELALAGRDAAVARERIAVTEESIRQAEENLRINRDRYLEKVGTATELLDAQTLLTQSRVDSNTALYDYQVALARVKKARGDL